MEENFDPITYANLVGQELVSSFDKAGLGTTSVLVGSAREHSVRTKLEHILPTGIAVGSGCVIDSYGNTSRQIDVVLYEKNICPVYFINDAFETAYYPCEAVVAVGEIKSSLGSRELEDIFRKIESVKRLRRFSNESSKERVMYVLNVPYRRYGTTAPVTHQILGDIDYDQAENPLDQIFGFALAGQLKLKVQTFCDKFVERARTMELNLTPNLIVTLDQGILCPATFPKEDEKGEIHISLQEATGIYQVDKGDENFRFLLSKIYDIYNHGRTVPVSAFGHYFDSEGVLTLPGGGIYMPIEEQIPESNE